jgi:hypothetical protein
VGVAVAAVGALGVCAAAAGVYDAQLWHAIAAATILLAAGVATLAGRELVERRRLAALGWALVATAPAEAALLLAANWREHVSRGYANVLVTATVLLLSGVVAGPLALVARRDSRAGRRGLAAVGACLVALDTVALVSTWTGSLPAESLRALLSLVFLTLLLALVTPLAQRLSRPH